MRFKIGESSSLQLPRRGILNSFRLRMVAGEKGQLSMSRGDFKASLLMGEFGWNVAMPSLYSKFEYPHIQIWFLPLA